MLRFAAVAALVVFAPSFAAADCALMGLAPKVLTVDGTAIPQTGGILVAAVPLDGGALDPGDAAIPKDWRFRGVKTKPTTVSLAPGLAVYRLPATDAVELEDAKGVVAKVKGTTDKRERPAPPKVVSVKYQTRMGRRSMTTVDVVLDGAPPAGVVAMILADAKGTPRSWGLVTGTTVAAFMSRDCLSLPNGTVGSKKGDRVVVYFVDDTGQKSDASKPLTITMAP